MLLCAAAPISFIRHYVEQQQTPDEQLTPCSPDLKDRALRRVFGKMYLKEQGDNVEQIFRSIPRLSRCFVGLMQESSVDFGVAIPIFRQGKLQHK